jgi:glycosyltransferase involved in cell wall biosynthesis
MNNILVAILTSGKPEKLERCIQSVQQNSSLFDKVVVCNSNDENFISLASQICYDNNIKCVNTRSNDTPGRGKNSVIDYFLKTENDWLFQVDGDDYITKNAISILENLVDNSNGEFDAACLINNKALSPAGELIDACDIPMQPSVAKKFLKYATQKDIDLFVRAQDIGRKHSFDGKGLNRLLLINKEVAKTVRFNEFIRVTEDFLFLQEVKRKFKVQPLDTYQDPVYIYDYGAGITDELITSGELIEHLNLLIGYQADYDDE